MNAVALRVDQHGMMLQPNFGDLCVQRRAAELALEEWREWAYPWEEGDEEAYSDAELLDMFVGMIVPKRDGKAFALRSNADFDLAEDDDIPCTPNFCLNRAHVLEALDEMTNQWAQCVGCCIFPSISAAERMAAA